MLSALPRLPGLLVLDNPVEPFKGNNWNSIFDKSGGKVAKIFEKGVFLVVKFGNFG